MVIAWAAEAMAQGYDEVDGCHLYRGPVGLDGYGAVVVDGLEIFPSPQPHRLIYEATFGPLGPGPTVDHLCHNRDLACRGGRSCAHRRCVNPDHMEAVTRGVNSSRRSRASREAASRA